MKQLMKNQHGQMMILNLMFLVMTILVFSALIPVLKTTLNNARGQDSLNCASSKNICGVTINDTTTYCYNSSKETETVGCLALDLYIPYIVLIVLVGGVMKLLAQRSTDQFAAPGQPGYGGYQ